VLFQSLTRNLVRKRLLHLLDWFLICVSVMDKATALLPGERFSLLWVAQRVVTKLLSVVQSDREANVGFGAKTREFFSVLSRFDRLVGSNCILGLPQSNEVTPHTATNTSAGYSAPHCTSTVMPAHSPMLSPPYRILHLLEIVDRCKHLNSPSTCLGRSGHVRNGTKKS